MRKLSQKRRDALLAPVIAEQREDMAHGRYRVVGMPPAEIALPARC